jgi:hypothetical protein
MQQSSSQRKRLYWKKHSGGLSKNSRLQTRVWQKSVLSIICHNCELAGKFSWKANVLMQLWLKGEKSQRSVLEINTKHFFRAPVPQLSLFPKQFGNK